jgi:hypothetical protein
MIRSSRWFIDRLQIQRHIGGLQRTRMGEWRSVTVDVLNLSDLLALIPVIELLHCDECDHQRQCGEHALLHVQWRNAQLGETLSVHPQAPGPPWWQSKLSAVDKAFIDRDIAVRVPVFKPSENPYKSIAYYQSRDRSYKQAARLNISRRAYCTS